jgi:hypothetical protein
MQNKYSTSVNIVRDSGRDLDYIPTPNTVRIVDQIGQDIEKGLRAFNIIGSYGTGKSSFLWAFQKSMTSKKKFFEISWLSKSSIDFINIVGEFRSIKDVFAERLNLKQSKNFTENIFSEIFNVYHDLGKRNPYLFIVIDEFGKFLEYAAQHEPEKELYFIQQLGEFVNNPDHRVVLITTVHQNFDAYAISLTGAQRQEWTKVKGRFREIPFNEPIEQLLFLASEHLGKKGNKKEKSTIKKAQDLFVSSKAFNSNAKYLSEISNSLYPLDLLSANILTIALQRYGQNERSLFSFLQSTDHTGIDSFNNEVNPFYNVACVYDYLIFNFYSFINSRYNPDFGAWRSIATGLEHAERTFETAVADYSRIIKTIGLLNLVSSKGAILDRPLLSSYCKLCLGINDAASLIGNLEQRKIILYRNYNKRFILFEGTDLDIQSAIDSVDVTSKDITDVSTLLKRYYQLPPVLAKKHTFDTGTPRLFEFIISEYPIHGVPDGEIDGFVNLIFNDKISLQDIQGESKIEKEAILYGYYTKTKDIRDLLVQMEKTRKVIEANDSDKIAIRELNNILQHQKNLLNHRILDSLYSDRGDVLWIYQGELTKVESISGKMVNISSKRDFNKKLSEICSSVYSNTPIFNNELVNKHKISASIHSAKRLYLKALVGDWDKPDLGFPVDKFPPEKTIYLSLLKQNGISLYSDKGSLKFRVTKTNAFDVLWETCEVFLETSKSAKRKVSELSELLSARPFKMKQGFIDFWLPSFLFIKRNDFALFESGNYIPYINDEVLELVLKYPSRYEIKAFDIDGVRLDLFNSYRRFLNQETKETISSITFIETIKPFLVFHKNLPEYAKETKRLSKKALAIRLAISNSKDPEGTFFDDFPSALGYTVSDLQKSKTKLKEYTVKLQDAIREIRTCYDELIGRVENFIQNEFVGEKLPFEGYKTKLQERYRSMKRHLLLPKQKTFLLRLDSQIDERAAWINSVVQALAGKTLDKFGDDDEILLYEQLKSIILELDSLMGISVSNFSEEHEDVLSLEISSFLNGVTKKLVRLPKRKQEEVARIETEIRSQLTKDKTMNIAALTIVLNDLLRK